MWNPRMGGEKILEPSMGVGNFGSPPRGRGKGSTLISHRDLLRITPAWAGKADPLTRRAFEIGITPAWAGKSSSEP